MQLPDDPSILLSLVNMKLRDYYPSLEALCQDLDIDRKDLVARLQAAGYEYNEQQNKFW